MPTPARPEPAAFSPAEAESAVERHLDRFFPGPGEVTRGRRPGGCTEHVRAPTPERPCWVFMTSGLSARPMAVPPQHRADGVRGRCELLLLLDAGWETVRWDPDAPEGERVRKMIEIIPPDPPDLGLLWPQALLHEVAALPGTDGVHLGAGTVLPHGSPPRPWSRFTDCTAVVLQRPVVPEFGVRSLEIGGHAVDVLQLVPLDPAGLALATAHDPDTMVRVLLRGHGLLPLRQGVSTTRDASLPEGQTRLRPGQLPLPIHPESPDPADEPPAPLLPPTAGARVRLPLAAAGVVAGGVLLSLAVPENGSTSLPLLVGGGLTAGGAFLWLLVEVVILRRNEKGGRPGKSLKPVAVVPGSKGSTLESLEGRWEATVFGEDGNLSEQIGSHPESFVSLMIADDRFELAFDGRRGSHGRFHLRTGPDASVVVADLDSSPVNPDAAFPVPRLHGLARFVGKHPELELLIETRDGFALRSFWFPDGCSRAYFRLRRTGGRRGS